MYRTKTAYGLLGQVARHILAEPLRYYQNCFLETRVDEIEDVMHGRVPVCGTMACIAGWMVLLNDGPKRMPRFVADRTDAQIISRRAVELLGMYPGDLFDEDTVCGISGTPEYAKEGAERIYAFMEEHKEHLKAHRLEDIKPLREELPECYF